MNDTRYYSYDEKKFRVGVILSVILIALKLIYNGPWLPLIVSVALILGSGRYRLNMEEKVCRRLYYGYLGLMPFVTVFLTQYLMGRKLQIALIRNICMGMLLMAIVMLILYILTLRVRASVFIAMILALLLVTANLYVLAFRGTELSFGDFSSLTTAAGVMEEYVLLIYDTELGAWQLLTALIYASCIFKPFKVRRKAKARFRNLVSLAGMLLIFVAGTQNLTVYHWTNQGSKKSVYILNFVLAAEEMVIKKPADYSKETVTALTSQYEVSSGSRTSTATESGEMPTVIVIMDESFSDLSVLGSELNTNTEVTPFISSLSENTISGYALSSVFGGNTANSEFEFLTGNSMSQLPAGAVAYQEYLKGETCSIVSDFNE